MTLCNHAVLVFERDLSAFLSYHCFLHALSFLFVCVLLLRLCSCLHVLTPSLTLSLIVIIFVRQCETPNLLRFLTNVFDIRKNIVVLKFDLLITWEGLSATLDQRRSPQRGVGFSRTTGKSLCLLSTLLYYNLCLPLSLNFTYILLLV
jgi:hypothetical protein